VNLTAGLETVVKANITINGENRNPKGGNSENYKCSPAKILKKYRLHIQARKSYTATSAHVEPTILTTLYDVRKIDQLPTLALRNQ
jgi:hypothetical protein